MKGKQHANVPYGKHANRLRKYLIHVVFVSLSYMLLKTKNKNKNAGRSAHNKNRYSLTLRDNTLRSRRLWTMISYINSLFFGSKKMRMHSRETCASYHVTRSVICAVALFAVFFSSDIFGDSQWQ